ncbi:NAD(P)-dependent oxidoreductase [Rhodobacteraceae bacterium]|nr:NAD(P)-dependent oxidoreductase [Paracoccaceae bacterium]
MSKKPQIGFIGVGYMGHGMAKNILQNGYPLMVKGNRNRTPVDNLVGMGAVEATSVAQMARDCDIIHICLSNSPQVEAIIRGPDGIIANGKAGLIVIDATTADPTSTEALAAEMAAAGMTLVDAPLGRTPKEAEEGTLDAMVGTDPDTFATILPVIECWAGNINHIGPVGSAHKMKLIMNFIAMGYSCLYSEAVTLGAKVGIAPQTINKVIGSSRLSNGFFDTFMKYTVGRDRDAHKFTIANASKDVRYVANMATAAGMANPMGAAMRNTYAQAEAVGKGDHYVPMLSDHIAELNGVDLAQVVKDNA